MSQLTVDQALQIAIQHQQNGQLPEAEDIYRQILAIYPDQADALHLLGVLAHQCNRNELAEELIRKALAVAPNTTAFRLSLGSILQAQQRPAEAITWYQQSLQIDPSSADLYSHLGVALCTVGRYTEAVDACQRALELKPNHAAASGNLGIAFSHLGRHDDALRTLRTAIAHNPKVAPFHASLAATLFAMGQTTPAISACQQAIAIDPTNANAHQTLSLIYTRLNRFPEAAEEARLAAEALPDTAESQRHLGDCLARADRPDDAIAAYQKGLLQHPQNADMHNNLANVLKDVGRLDEALDHFRKAATLQPFGVQFHSNFLYSLNFHPAWTPPAIFAELRKFDKQLAAPLAGEVVPHFNDPSPTRRLRIGYVSNEFRAHVIGINMLPLFANHDKTQVEVFCYADVSQPDFYTFRFQQLADHWIDIQNQNAQQVADLVRRDQIDILVNLTMHLQGERLLASARKPAPVQVAFAAYPGTTGLSAIDYRLTDINLEPEGALVAPSSETPIRLPHSFWCYQPHVSDAAVNALPAKDLGYITFGNLNNFVKLNEKTFELWATIMRGVTRSRLIMLTGEGAHRQKTRDFFAHHGITPDRIDFVPRMPPEKYLRVYHRIDVGLDSFPYNGHTTSLDAFFMGVPVVTIIGDTPVSRAGYSQLVNLGLPELAGKSPSEFVRLATELANDWPRLEKLRADLRSRMQASPLMNQKQFAQSIEAAYRQMWHTWCNTPEAQS